MKNEQHLNYTQKHTTTTTNTKQQKQQQLHKQLRNILKTP